MSHVKKRHRTHPARPAEWLYGVHPVTEALKAGRRTLYEMLLLKGDRGGRLTAVRELADSRQTPIRLTDAADLERRCGSENHQGVAMRVGGFPFRTLEDLVENASEGVPSPFIVLLDSIQDPHNLGAIVRTALCAGADGLVVPRDRSAPAGPVVSRVSAGALEHAILYQVTNLADTIERLRKLTRIWVVGLDPQASTTIYDADLRGPLGLVVGGEGKGIRPLVRKRCDDLVVIPQSGPVNSLNASVASAVGIYEVVRQRRAMSAG
jgi:23S rRNA (guanosine2251-2'-O)-methyltransferase